MAKDEQQKPEETKKTGWEASKLRKLKIYTYVQNKLESLMSRDPLLIDTLNGKRIDLKNPSRENYDLALATCLVRTGKLADDEIKIIMRNFFRHGRGNSANDEYFDKTVNKAHETIQGVVSREAEVIESYNPISARKYYGGFLAELELRQKTGHQRAWQGMDTGFPVLNEYIGGIEEQTLILLLGKAGCGKTSLALQIAGEMVRLEKNPCLYVSYTQSFFNLNLMLYCRLCAIPHQILSKAPLAHKHQERLEKIEKKELEEWGEHMMFMEADDTKSLQTIRATCEELKPGLLVIDSMENVPSGKALHPKARIDELSGELSRMAIDLKMGIIAIASLDGKASLSEYTGGDVVLYLNESTKLEPPELSLVILKNRLGEKDKTILYEFNPQIFQFREKGLKERKEMYIEQLS